jgi:hypothetical protein
VAGLTAFCVVLAAVAAATCALSYAGLHAVAEQGGIQAQYAKGYPLLIDAILVIVLGAVLALRGAGLPSRILSWLALVVLLTAAAGAEALHATRRALPREAAAITVAVLPWLLVLITFVLLLAMLRHARLRQSSRPGRTHQAPAYPDIRAGDPRRPRPPPDTRLPAQTPQLRNSAPIVPGLSSRLVSAAAAGGAAGRAAGEMESGGPEGGSAGPAAPGQPDASNPAPGRDAGGASDASDAGDAGEAAGPGPVVVDQHDGDTDLPDDRQEGAGPASTPEC